MHRLRFALVLVSLTFCFVSPRQALADEESSYARVMRTGVIRCSYFVVPPEFNKDANTGKLSGIGYEVTEAVGKLLGLRIEWTTEIGFGEMQAGLDANRYDAICSSVFNRAPLARQADFTVPFMYTPVGIFVRQDDARFDKNLSAINNPSITISAIDGESSNEIANQDFPNSRRFTMPQSTDISMLLESVATKKGDVALTYPANFYQYNKSNPGKLKSIHSDKPIRAFGNAIMIKRGEQEFKSMLNSAINELLNSGYVETVISKYEPYPNAYYRVESAYKNPQNTP